MDPIRDYVRLLKTILVKPTNFFRNMPKNGGMAGPLAFALATHWIGTAIEFFWETLLGQFSRGLVARLFESEVWTHSSFEDFSDGRLNWLRDTKSKLYDWFFETGSVILDPITTLFIIGFSATMVFAGARILTTSKPNRPSSDLTRSISFESAIRLTSYAMAPSILLAVPFTGSFVVPMWSFILMVIAVREVYQLSTGKSVGIALIPLLSKLILVIAVIALVTFLAILFAFFFAMAF